MKWTDEQLAKFRADPYINEESIYADSIMRPMAEALCPQVLQRFDAKCNVGDDPLGPNWHTFASELEEAVKVAHKVDSKRDLERYYTFLNWALFEKTSYLSDETIVSPFEGIIEISPEKWMKYIPIPIIDKMITFMQRYMVDNIAIGMRRVKGQLLADVKYHENHWKPCHRKFTKIAIENNIPYTNFL